MRDDQDVDLLRQSNLKSLTSKEHFILADDYERKAVQEEAKLRLDKCEVKIPLEKPDTLKDECDRFMSAAKKLKDEYSAMAKSHRKMAQDVSQWEMQEGYSPYPVD
jgi:hypothetical protein